MLGGLTRRHFLASLFSHTSLPLLFRNYGYIRPRHTLTEQMQVVRARFGLDGLQPKTLEDIGRAFRLTRERVRQIELRALYKLRQPYRNYRVRDYSPEQAVMQNELRASFAPPTPGDVAAAASAIADAEASAQREELNAVRVRMGLEPLGEDLFMDAPALEVEDYLGHIGRFDEHGAVEVKCGSLSDMDMQSAQRSLEEQWALEMDESHDHERGVAMAGAAGRGADVIQQEWSLKANLEGLFEEGTRDFRNINEPWALRADVPGKGTERWANMDIQDQLAMERAAELWSTEIDSQQLGTDMTPEEWARELAAFV